MKKNRKEYVEKNEFCAEIDKYIKEEGKYSSDANFLAGLETAQVIMEKMKPSNMWTSVKEKMPDRPGSYLVNEQSIYGSFIEVAYYGKIKTSFITEKGKECFYTRDLEYGDVLCDKVVAWMELPEPYGVK